MHDDRYGYGMSWGGFFLVGLLLLILVGLTVGLVVWLVTRPDGAPASAAPSTGSVSPARAILDERFARGEIDEDEYRRRRVMLEGG